MTRKIFAPALVKVEYEKISQDSMFPTKASWIYTRNMRGDLSFFDCLEDVQKEYPNQKNIIWPAPLQNSQGFIEIEND